MRQFKKKASVSSAMDTKQTKQTPWLLVRERNIPTDNEQNAKELVNYLL
jgi:hypothetical protein